MSVDWTWWILASAVMLAIYDLLKKASVRDNAVMPVLTIATAAGAVAYIGSLAALGDVGAALCPGAKVLWLALIKTLIVGSSWILTYRALQTLPITIATPIRASAPAVVIMVAIFLYGESPSAWQWLGMSLVILGFAAFSWAGKAEGISFLRSHAVWFAVGGMLMSAVSALWDKYIFQIAGMPVEPVQFWFQIGLFVLYSLILVFQLGLSRWGAMTMMKFCWRPTIPLVGVSLALADWLYFHGLALPGVPISVGSLMRRFSVVITFVIGAMLFHETNLKRKSVAMVVILTGVVILCVK